MTMNAYAYKMGRYTAIELEWGENQSFEEFLTTSGYETFPSVTYGEQFSFCIKVYSGKQDTDQPQHYFIELDLGDSWELIQVDALPSLLHLLQQIVPLARATLVQERYEEREEEKRNEVRVRRK